MKPDLVAAGRSVVSLRAPGSTIDQIYPTARLGAANFVGSGTSFSTAVTSGAVALLLHSDPSLLPDQVKGRLLAAATPGPVGDPFVDGHGDLDVAAAALIADVTVIEAAGAVGPVAVGPDTVGASVSLADTWETSTWDPAAWQGWSPPPAHGAAPVASGGNWAGSVWNAAVWAGSVWTSGAWGEWYWDSATWQGTAWDGAVWTTEAWNDSQWG
jgi:serine protease AprX